MHRTGGGPNFAMASPRRFASPAFASYPSWSQQQVNNTLRDDTGHMLSMAVPHYSMRSTPYPRTSRGEVEPKMHMRLHHMSTHAKAAKELEYHGVPPCATMQPPKVRPFAQPSVPDYATRRMRPASARPAYGMPPPMPYGLPLDAMFPPFKKGLTKRITQAVVATHAEAPLVDEAPAAETKQAQRKQERNVSAAELRACAGGLKEKLIDKFGSLTRAFRAVDVDGSGTITRDELNHYLLVVNLHTTFRTDVIDALFEMIDADASGSFDYKEFARVMSSGDVMKMDAVAARFDGYEAKRLEAEAKERAAKEYQAKLVGMTVEEYDAYWNTLPKTGHEMATSSEMAQVARDRWGHKIRGNAQAHAV